MRGTIKRTGTRNLSGHENELEEYFAELEEARRDPEASPNPDQGTFGLTALEELRRLTAYVVHLREKAASLQGSQPIQTVPNPIGAIVAVTVMVGIAAGVGVMARHLSRRI